MIKEAVAQCLKETGVKCPIYNKHFRGALIIWTPGVLFILLYFRIQHISW